MVAFDADMSRCRRDKTENENLRFTTHACNVIRQKYLLSAGFFFFMFQPCAVNVEQCQHLNCAFYPVGDQIER